MTFFTRTNLPEALAFVSLGLACLTALVGVSVWELRGLLRRVRTLDDLLALTPTQFERVIGELLQTWGYTQVRHTGGSGDLAADLTCRAPDGKLVIVQCKRFARHNKVGSPEVQKFIGMMAVHHGADIGIFVTTSHFTQPARVLCQQHGIRAVAGDELADHLTRMRKEQLVASR